VRKRTRIGSRSFVSNGHATRDQRLWLRGFSGAAKRERSRVFERRASRPLSGGAGCSSHVSAAAERTSEPEAGSFPNVRSAADVGASGPDRLSRRLVWTQPFVMDRGPKNQGAWHRTCIQPGMRLVLSAPEERPYPPLVREQVFTRSSHRHASLRGIERGARSRPPLGGTVRLLLWMTRRSLREFLHLSHV